MSAHPIGPWPFPRLLAHRGGGALAPENTLAGLRLAARLGYAGDRVRREAQCRGRACSHARRHPRPHHLGARRGGGRWHSPNCRTLDAGSWFGRAFAGERVPTYEAAAEACRALGLWANVEIKPCPGREAETGHAVARQSTRLWAGYAHPPLLSSFSVEALAAAKAPPLRLSRGLLVEDAAGRLACGARRPRLCRPARAAYQRHAGAGRGECTPPATACCATPSTIPPAPRCSTRRGVDCIVTDRLDLFDPA